MFGVGIWNTLGVEKAQEFFAGYLLEQSLSVDNLFVFILVFRYFRAPKADQDKVMHCLNVKQLLLYGSSHCMGMVTTCVPMAELICVLCEVSGMVHMQILNDICKADAACKLHARTNQTVCPAA